MSCDGCRKVSCTSERIAGVRRRRRMRVTGNCMVPLYEVLVQRKTGPAEAEPVSGCEFELEGGAQAELELTIGAVTSSGSVSATAAGRSTLGLAQAEVRGGVVRLRVVGRRVVCQVECLGAECELRALVSRDQRPALVEGHVEALEARSTDDITSAACGERSGIGEQLAGKQDIGAANRNRGVRGTCRLLRRWAV